MLPDDDSEAYSDSSDSESTTDNSESSGAAGDGGNEGSAGAQSATNATNLGDAQNDANENMSSAPVSSGVNQCGGLADDSSSAFDESSEVSPEKKSWIAIKLVDQNGKPVPNEEYRIVLPDGTPVDGHLNKRGFARVNGIDSGTCEVTFPKIDSHDWKRI